MRSTMGYVTFERELQSRRRWPQGRVERAHLLLTRKQGENDRKDQEQSAYRLQEVRSRRKMVPQAANIPTKTEADGRKLQIGSVYLVSRPNSTARKWTTGARLVKRLTFRSSYGGQPPK